MDGEFWEKLVLGSISAISGLGGVGLGAWATSKREHGRDAKTLLSDRTYLSTLLTVELERFVDNCYAVAFDNGLDDYGQPAGERGSHMATTEKPQFTPEKISGNWRSLDSFVMDEALLLPYRIDEITRLIAIASHFSDPPEYAEYFNARRYWYAVLGLEVVALIDIVRSSAGLKAMSRSSGDSARESRMREVCSSLASKVVE